MNLSDRLITGLVDFALKGAGLAALGLVNEIQKEITAQTQQSTPDSPMMQQIHAEFEAENKKD